MQKRLLYETLIGIVLLSPLITTIHQRKRKARQFKPNHRAFLDLLHCFIEFPAGVCTARSEDAAGSKGGGRFTVNDRGALTNRELYSYM